MKINGYNNVNPMTNTKNTANAQAIEKQPQFAARDQMKVSGNAQLMQKLLQKAKEIPDIREEKVQEITARIENGQFEIDSNIIARKILGMLNN
ncbi:MAG: flagellar biosynthesis anti-sigma factor FlgM [Gracilibacteraceae bacterium]|jgi:negative regulator of flagellin synthesis FlgM|nr:flagellar biosynthesis anti-sigma factor FlgM [Gracilibacteraceae bacterium]